MSDNPVTIGSVLFCFASRKIFSPFSEKPKTRIYGGWVKKNELSIPKNADKTSRLTRARAYLLVLILWYRSSRATADCTGVDGVRKELERLTSRRLLTPEQAQIVDCRAIATFFDTQLGQKLRSGAAHLREFKFSILDNGGNYGPGLEEEQVLLQGVVDCAILEDAGITVIDFKTDAVTEETLSAVTARYAPQVQTYAHALSRIYGMPVCGAYLYYFRLGKFVDVKM